MSENRGISVSVPADLHDKVKEEVAAKELTMSQYIIQIIEEHFNGGNKIMSDKRTIAFQADEELFQRLKAYLGRHPEQNQKAFITRLLEEALAADEMAQTRAGAG